MNTNGTTLDLDDSEATEDHPEEPPASLTDAKKGIALAIQYLEQFGGGQGETNLAQAWDIRNFLQQQTTFTQSNVKDFFTLNER